MKTYIKYGLFALLIVAGIAGAYAFKGEEKADNVEFFAKSQASQYRYTLDSISNTANDTTVITGIFESDFTYRIGIQLANGTGTRALKIYLDDYNGGQSSNAGIYATGWTVRDSITPTTTNNEYAFIGTHVYGFKHRIRVDGNTGATQKTYFRINGLYKPID